MWSKSPTGQDVPRGRCGTRGELIRHPEESGNAYGDSTWVDEFAQWGTTKTTRVCLGVNSGHKG